MERDVSNSVKICAKYTRENTRNQPKFLLNISPATGVPRSDIIQCLDKFILGRISWTSGIDRSYFICLGVKESTKQQGIISAIVHYFQLIQRFSNGGFPGYYISMHDIKP